MDALCPNAGNEIINKKAENYDDRFGIIILRHVNSETTNQHWIYCYDCVRKVYPNNKILIIDDNSNYRYVSNKKLINTMIIQSEYPGRGELLPYYYFEKTKPFDRALIIHDSVYIYKKIQFDNSPYQFLWDFQHDWDQIEDEKKILKVFGQPELLKFHEEKELWKGCFGGMSVITHEYISKINSQHNLGLLINCIKNRYNRMSFERVIACLLTFNNDNKRDPPDTLFGNIHSYLNSIGIEFGDKLDLKSIDRCNAKFGGQVPIIKNFSRR